MTPETGHGMTASRSPKASETWCTLGQNNGPKVLFAQRPPALDSPNDITVRSHL